MKKPENRGGKRPNQTGRPPMGDPIVKVNFAFRPEIIKKLDDLAEQAQLTRTQVLAKLISKTKKINSKPTQ